MQPNRYAEIFEQRGDAYHQAMQRYPNARDREFETALELLNVQQGDRILDIPAGGEYLKKHVQDQCEFESVCYQSLEFSKGFHGHTKAENINNICSETDFGIADANVDRAISLAALHHIENKLGFFDQLHRCLSPGGKLVIGDVIANSPQARFLNEFVDQWNSMGHNGDFIDPTRDLLQLEKVGFNARYVTRQFVWHFENRASCHHYLSLLFSLDKRPQTALFNSAIEALGVIETKSVFQLTWALGFLIAEKAS